jgi:hypothetical protein
MLFHALDCGVHGTGLCITLGRCDAHYDIHLQLWGVGRGWSEGSGSRMLMFGTWRTISIRVILVYRCTERVSS